MEMSGRCMKNEPRASAMTGQPWGTWMKGADQKKPHQGTVLGKGKQNLTTEDMERVAQNIQGWQSLIRALNNV